MTFKMHFKKCKFYHFPEYVQQYDKININIFRNVYDFVVLLQKDIPT